MTAHLCTEITAGCFRCELNLDEIIHIESMPKCVDDCEDFACDGDCASSSAAVRAASPRSRDGHGSATGGQTNST